MMCHSKKPLINQTLMLNAFLSYHFVFVFLINLHCNTCFLTPPPQTYFGVLVKIFPHYTVYIWNISFTILLSINVMIIQLLTSSQSIFVLLTSNKLFSDAPSNAFNTLESSLILVLLPLKTNAYTESIVYILSLTVNFFLLIYRHQFWIKSIL